MLPNCGNAPQRRSGASTRQKGNFSSLPGTFHHRRDAASGKNRVTPAAVSSRILTNAVGRNRTAKKIVGIIVGMLKNEFQKIVSING
jgi:hypothetical protein